MKHAINELKALLDTWGPQKEAAWRDHLGKAIAVLENTANITEWHNDPENKYASTVAEVEAGIPVGGRVAVPYNPEYQDYASTEYGASLEQIRACSERNQSEAVADIESGRAEKIDDDLGELDPSKACDLSKEGGCESCQ